jgi:hypothetical protein
MNGVGIAAAVILGPVGVFLLVAIVLRLRAQRNAPEWRADKLADLSREHIDPHWPQIHGTLGDPPPGWDPCVVRDPKTPQQGDEDR